MNHNENKHLIFGETSFKIAQKCNRLPLVAMVLGSTLRFKINEME